MRAAAIGVGLLVMLGPAVASAEEAPPAKVQPKKRKGVSERRRAQEALALMQQLLDLADGDRALLESAQLDREMPSVLIIRVTDTWEEMSKVRRLSNAEDLWQMWVKTVTDAMPGKVDPDHWRISIENRHGHRIGGSRVWGGSLIWVD